MSDAKKVADRALVLAGRFIDDSKSELLEMAGGDPGVLYKASQIVREKTVGMPASQHSAEHLAFSLIAAAHDVLRQEAEEQRSE